MFTFKMITLFSYIVLVCFQRGCSFLRLFLRNINNKYKQRRCTNLPTSKVIGFNNERMVSTSKQDKLINSCLLQRKASPGRDAFRTAQLQREIVINDRVNYVLQQFGRIFKSVTPFPIP